MDAITKTHETNQDQLIQKLKSDLQRERANEKITSETNRKLDEIKSTIKTIPAEIKSDAIGLMKEGCEKITSKTTNQIRDFSDKTTNQIKDLTNKTTNQIRDFSDKMIPMVESMKIISDNSVSITKTLEHIANTLQFDNINQGHKESQVDSSNRMQMDNQPQEDTNNTQRNKEPHVQTDGIPMNNRYSPLAEKSKNEAEK